MNEIFKYYCDNYNYIICKSTPALIEACGAVKLVWKRLKKNDTDYVIIWNRRKNLVTGNSIEGADPLLAEIAASYGTVDRKGPECDISKYSFGTEGPLHHVVATNELPC